MNKKLVTGIFAFTVLAGTGVGYRLYYGNAVFHFSDQSIVLYDRAKHRKSIDRIFNEDFHTLTANPDHSMDLMLEKRSPNRYEQKYFGKMDTVVLLEVGQVAGFISYFMRNNYEGKILFLAIDSQFRRKGYARRLAQHGIDELKKQGAKFVVLHTRVENNKAQQLYESMGFVRKYEENGFFFYRKEL